MAFQLYITFTSFPRSCIHDMHTLSPCIVNAESYRCCTTIMYNSQILKTVCNTRLAVSLNIRYKVNETASLF